VNSRLLGGLGAKLVVVEGGGVSLAALLRCELSLYMTEPAHPQSNNAIRDLVDVCRGVFFQFFWEFHFEPKSLNLMTTAARLKAAGRKSPSRELGGLGAGLGLLIFETETHSATGNITIAVELGSISPRSDKGRPHIAAR
jgi:hypothetical protein